MPVLEKLDLRWNPLTRVPERIGRLRECGCIVLT